MQPTPGYPRLILALLLLPLSAVGANPLLLGDSIYLSEQGIHRFNRASLSLDWSSLEQVSTFAPVAGEGLIFAGSSSGLYALDAESGQQLWRIEDSKTLFSPTVAEQLFAGSVEGWLYAIDPASGAINWQHHFPGWIYSPAHVASENSLWTGGQTHQLTSLNATSGSVLSTIATSQELVFSPSILDKRHIAFDLFDGKAIVVDAISATVESKLQGNIQPINTVSQRDRIYRSFRNGDLRAYDKKKFHLMWTRKLVAQDLTMHPSQEGFLLLSDRDQTLILFNLDTETEICRRQISGNWFAPIQIEKDKIVYFKKTLQRPEVFAVEVSARC